MQHITINEQTVYATFVHYQSLDGDLFLNKKGRQSDDRRPFSDEQLSLAISIFSYLRHGCVHERPQHHAYGLRLA